MRWTLARAESMARARIEPMNHATPDNNESTAQTRLEHPVSAWNQSSFEAYCHDFTQHLVDHYNPSYFTRIRNQSGQWLSNRISGA